MAYWLAAAIGALGLVAAGALGYLRYAGTVGARELLVPAPSVPKSDPADYGLNAADVSLTTEDGLRLAAWLVPARSDTKAAIALFHGHTASRSQLLPYARFLSERFHCLLVDMRGHGDSAAAPASLGAHEARDVLAAIEWLAAKGHGPIGAWGMSMGGAAALIAAADEPRIAGVVTDCTFDAAAHPIAGRAAQRGYPLPGLVARAVLRTVERRLEADLLRRTPAWAIARIAPRPVLVIHGAADETTPLGYGRALYEAAGQPREWLEVPGAGHTEAHARAGAEYEARVTAFFTRALALDIV